MKIFCIILFLFIAGCSNTTTPTDVKAADYLCDKSGWDKLESNDTIQHNVRFIKVWCKDKSVRSTTYNVVTNKF